MSDQAEAFRRQFTPVDGGYLYYPSRKRGGKLVTAEEFQALVEDWQRRTRSWKIAGLVFVAITTWTTVSQIAALPDWADDIIVWGLVAAITAWILWAAYAPRRLVKSRPVIAPPRELSEVRRQARSVLNWPLVVVALLMSGAIFIGLLSSPAPTLKWWAWTGGSGLMFFAYLWIGIQKFRDERH